MSRKGKNPIILGKSVEVKVEGDLVTVKGPKGTQQLTVGNDIQVAIEDGKVIVSLKKNNDELSKFHGLYRSLIQNMVDGITKGFEKILELVGVGYRAAVKGNVLDLQLGFSHPTQVAIPEGIEVKIEKGNVVSITGINKQQVGQFAAWVRGMRPPEPYQGKGVRYRGEYIRRKAGKSASK